MNDTSRSLFVVWLMNPKFARARAAKWLLTIYTQLSQTSDTPRERLLEEISMRRFLIAVAATTTYLIAPVAADEANDDGISLPTFDHSETKKNGYFGNDVPLEQEDCNGQDMIIYVNKARAGGSFDGFRKTAAMHQAWRESMYGEAAGEIRTFIGGAESLGDGEGIFGTIRMQNGSDYATRKAIYEKNKEAIDAKSKELGDAYAKDTDGYTSFGFCILSDETAN